MLLRKLFTKAVLLAVIGMGIFAGAQEAQADVRDITMQVNLRYLNGTAKSFTWRLRYYPATGLCLGRVTDRDGVANFDGSYNPITRRFRLVKHYPYRTTGRKRYYYTGTRRGKRFVSGVARFDSHMGRTYARWTATVLFSRSVYRPVYRNIQLSGFLRYLNASEPNKGFRWSLRYDAGSGVCIGTVRDRDGFATFNGTYDRISQRFYLVKHFTGRTSGRSKFYYKGRIINGRFVGTAHFDSFYGQMYARWSANKRW